MDGIQAFSFWEHLVVDRATQVPSCGDLHEEHTHVLGGQSIVAAHQVPCRAHDAVADQIRGAVLQEKRRDHLGRIFHKVGVHCVGQVAFTCRSVETQCRVGVVHHLGVEGEERSAQPACRPRQVPLAVEHAIRGADRHGLVLEAVDRAQPVCGVQHVHLESVRRHAFLHRGRSFDREVVVLAAQAVAVTVGIERRERAQGVVHEGCFWGIVARACFAASRFFSIAHPIGVDVGHARPSTHAQGVELVSVAIAIALWDVRTATFVDVARAVAHAARVVHPHAIVHVVADAISVRVGLTASAANAKGVELVAQAVAITLRNVCASAFQRGAWTVAHATDVHNANAVVDVVTNAVVVLVGRAIATAHPNRVELVAVAIAVAVGDVCAPTFVNLPRASTHAASVKDLAVAVAEALFGKITRAVVQRGLWVEVARIRVDASAKDFAVAKRPCAVEGDGDLDLVCAHAKGENLVIEDA